MVEHPPFELGPIRPPSEAGSLLVRMARNCPWNKCAFCTVYKKSHFSLRTAADVLRDLDNMARIHGTGPETVFLQDADPLISPLEDVVSVLEGIRQRFPRVRRVTTYARSHTLARMKPEQLVRLREAGLDRIHVGFESGCDRVLKLIRKGVDQRKQIIAGQKVAAAGFELSEYWMPGLGGARLTDSHADESALALVQIRPQFIRLRTTSVIRRSPLTGLREEGDWLPLDEVAVVREIRRFVLGLGTLNVRIESDHVLNLLMDLRGNWPDDRERMLGMLDGFLDLPAQQQEEFIRHHRDRWRGVL